MRVPPYYRKITVSPLQRKKLELESRKLGMSMQDYIEIWGVPQLTEEERDLEDSQREVDQIAPGFDPEVLEDARERLRK